MSPALPTDRELEALKLLWRKKRATVREIWNVLRRSDRELAYTTVLSLMQTMEQKGLVGHEPSGRAYAYYAHVGEEQTLGQISRRFIDKVFDGAVDQYLVRALESKQPNEDELRRLEEMIAAARRKSRRRGRKRGES